MRVYYAHSMALYGTAQEKRDIRTLLDLLFEEVIDPSEYAVTGAETSMSFYLGLVSGCDALAFRALPDGSISAGVWKEIEHAQALGLPVFELPSLALRRVLSIEETRAHLAEVGQR